MENDILDTLEDLGYAYTSLRVSLLHITGYPSVSLCQFLSWPTRRRTWPFFCTTNVSNVQTNTYIHVNRQMLRCWSYSYDNCAIKAVL